MTLLEEFTHGLQGKDLDQLIHEAKAESENRVLGQGIAYLALFLADVMVKAMTTAHPQALHQWLTQPPEPHPTTPHP